MSYQSWLSLERANSPGNTNKWESLTALMPKWTYPSGIAHQYYSNSAKHKTQILIAFKSINMWAYLTLPSAMSIAYRIDVVLKRSSHWQLWNMYSDVQCMIYTVHIWWSGRYTIKTVLTLYKWYGHCKPHLGGRSGLETLCARSRESYVSCRAVAV